MNNIAKIDFKEHWKIPFRYDGYGTIWSANNEKVFTFNDVDKDDEAACKKRDDMANNFVSLLNGNGGKKVNGLKSRSIDLYITKNRRRDVHIGYFSGLRHLWMEDGYNLPFQDAHDIIDELIAWCMERIGE